MVGKLNGLMVVVAGIALSALPAAAQNRPRRARQELVGQLNQLGRETIAMAAVGEDAGRAPGRQGVRGRRPRANIAR